MIIQNSEINLRSQHQFVSYEEEHESLEVWHTSGTKNDAQSVVQGLSFKSDSVSISAEAESLSLIDSSAELRSQEIIPEVDDLEDDLKVGWKLKLLKRLVENLTGREIKLFKREDLKSQPDVSGVENAEAVGAVAPGSENETLGWGVNYQYQHRYHEEERSSFSAQGLINTADGRQIEIDLQLSMSRSFSSTEQILLRAGDALKDPLVINYAGTAAQLETSDLSFDIDLDGMADQLNFVTPGSGFIALDVNGDGVINDGRELFGPKTGDGYQELAGYDQDGNNWIDENDDVFSRLRVWTRDSEDNFQLFSLADLGIGAISLAHASTPFSLNDSDNQQLGLVRDSGIFLYESGGVGSVQQIDLAV